MNMIVSVVIADAVIETHALNANTVDAGPCIDAVAGASYLLTPADSAHPPENLAATRLGDDLQLEHGGAGRDRAGLMIRDFYRAGARLGWAQDGGDHDGRAALLPDGAGVQSLQHGDSLMLASAGGPPPSSPYRLDGGARTALPQIEAVLDDQGAIQGVIAHNGHSDDGLPLITGNATPGVQVHLYDGVELIGRVTAGADGTWSFAPRAPLADGRHELSIIHEYPNGDTSDFSDLYVINVDKTTPDAPLIHGMLDDEGRITGQIVGESITDDARPTVNGTAEPHASVIIYDKGKEIGRAAVDGEGSWRYTPSVALKDGTHLLSYAVVDRAGNQSEATGMFEFTVDTRPELVSIQGANDDVGAVTGLVASGGVTDDTTPTLQGAATAGGIVKIYHGDTLLGQTTAGFDGQWHFTPGIALAAGGYALQATVTLEGKGESARSAPYELTIEVEVPNTASITQLVDDLGSMQGVIGEGEATNDGTPTLEGRADAGATVCIYSNGSPLGTAIADAGGHWSFTASSPLSDGENRFTVTTLSSSGGESDPSTAYTVLLDTTPPDMPSITRIIDDVGAQTGEVLPGGISDDSKPLITGMAEAGSTVVLFDAGIEIGRVQADMEGTWSFMPATPLAKGAHELAVQAIDKVGNASTPSNGFGFVVESNGDDHPATLVHNGAVVDLRILLDASTQTAANFAAIKSAAMDAVNAYLSAGIGLNLIVYANGVATSMSLNPGGSTGYLQTKLAAVVMNSKYSFNDDFHASIQTSFIGRVFENPSFLYIGDAQNTVTSAKTEWDSAREAVADGAFSLVSSVNMACIAIPAMPTGTHLITMLGLVTMPIVVAPTPTEMVNIIPNNVVVSSVRGNVLGNDVDVDRNGSERISSISHGETVFRINASNKLEVVNATSSLKGVYNAAKGLLTIEDGDGMLWIWMRSTGEKSAGDYAYDLYQSRGAAEAAQKSFRYVATNNMGQSQESTLHVTIAPKSMASAMAADSEAEIDAGAAHPLPGNDGVAAAGREVASGAGADAGSRDAGIHAAPRLAIPLIDALVDDQGAVRGVIDNGGHTDDGRPEISGKAEPGVRVHIYDGVELIGRVIVGEDGEWSFSPRAPLADGRHEISILHEYPDGNASDFSAMYVINVDKVTPDIPVFNGLLDHEGRITGPVANEGITDDGRPTIDGTAEPHATVIIYDLGKEVGRAVVDGEGNWSFTPLTPLKDGLHVLDYATVDRAGNESERSEPFEFTVDTRAERINIHLADDDVGDITGTVASGGVTDDTLPTLQGSATAGGIVKIYEGSLLLGQTVAEVDGTWSFTPTAPLSQGEHALQATVTLAAKGESDRSPAFTLTVDSVAPDKPSIESVHDNVGDLQGMLAHGASTDDNTPTLAGRAEPNSTVRIYDNGSLLASVQADGEGVWSFTTQPLSDGLHAFSVTSRDKAGNVSEASDVHAVTVDTVAPDRPSIDTVHDDEGAQTGNLGSGDRTDDATPTLGGRAEPDSTVVIKDKGVEIGRAPVAADGRWTFEPNLPLGKGEHVFTVESVDAAGNASQPSVGFELTVVDDAAPAMPTITQVSDDVGAITGNLAMNAVTDDARPTVGGTAQAGMTVAVYSNGQLLGTVVADGTGAWTFTPTADLADGPHDITATATNAVGNVSAATPAFPITVDTQPPARPEAGEAMLIDDQGAITGPIRPNDVTDDNLPTFEGTTEANATVVIYDNGVKLGSTQADPAGNWGFTPATPLLDGVHRFDYEVVDAAGNASSRSDAIDFTVNTQAQLITLDGAHDAVGSIVGAIGNGGVTDDATPTLHGTATANGLVSLYEGGTLLGQVQAAADGTWQLQLPVALAQGAHSLHATVTTAAGGESGPSAPFGFTVDLDAPATPSIVEVLDDVGSAQGQVGNGQTTDDAKPTLKGQAEAKSTVHIHDGGTLLGSVQAGADGAWSFTPEAALVEGSHVFTVTSEDAAGNQSAASDSHTIIVDTIAPSRPTIDTVHDDQGAQTGNLANGGRTDDDRPTLSGRAEPNSTVIIKDQGVEIGRATVDALGGWTFEPGTALASADEVHVFTVEAVDLAGNVSQPSESFTVTIDASGAGKPVITVVLDDQGPRQGPLGAGGVTDDVKPKISGTAKAGSTVTVWDNGTALGQVLADASGNWTFEPATALQDGLHEIQVTAVDALGGAGEASDPFGFEVNTVTPDMPNISNIRDDVGLYQGILRSGGTTDDTRPTVTGTGKVGDIIEIRAGGVVLGTGVVGDDGRWSITTEAELGQGVCVFTAVAVSPSGVESAASNSYQITVDTIAPEVPVIDTVVDNYGTWKGELNNGDFTDDRTPTFNGRAEPNTTIEVFDRGEYIGDAVVDANGNWSYTPNKILSYGEHLFTFLAFDKAFNKSEITEEWSILVGAPTRAAGLDDAVEAGAMQGLLVDGEVALFEADALPATGAGSSAGLSALAVADALDDARIVTTGVGPAVDSSALQQHAIDSLRPSESLLMD